MDLQTIWFLLWGLLWAIFFMTDGFDFGVGILYPFLGKSNEDRRIMINAIGPLWDGNEVWLITAGGVTFAAFPLLYAVMFSSLYSALMLILFALILRGVSFEFRGHIDNHIWRKIWDFCIFTGSVTPAILFGVAFANIYQGIPIDANGVYQGNLFTLLNPYGILGGLVYLTFFMIHGAIWLAIRTEGDLQERASIAADKLWPVVLVMATVFLIYSKFATSLYNNYFAYPILFAVILITVTALVGIKLFLVKRNFFRAWFASALTIVGATFFGVIGLYPNMFPSSINADFNITVHNAASSPLTLKIMLVVVIIFVPVVIGYQIWAYNLFKGKVTAEDLTY